jgi:cytochrome c peroxidase
VPFDQGVKALRFGWFVVKCLLAVGCSGEERKTPEPTLVPTAYERVGPIARVEPARGLDPAKVELGKRLFSDTRLSGDGKVACSTCHDLSAGGADHVPLSKGMSGQTASVNTPTVFNAALNFRQFWDGHASNLEDQVDGPLLNPREMGSSWAGALSAIERDDELSAAFAKAYQGVNASNVRDAIATFERSLVTPDSPFDRFLAGDEAAIDDQVKRGYELFKSYGCSSCHQGRGVGGNMFQKLGVMADYFKDRGRETEADQGRFNVTHDEVDRHVFKVPSLRNVSRTAPYLHDGSVATLEEAVRVMARYQLGRDLVATDVTTIVAFLKSLTGKYEGRPL